MSRTQTIILALAIAVVGTIRFCVIAPNTSGPAEILQLKNVVETDSDLQESPRQR